MQQAQALTTSEGPEHGYRAVVICRLGRERYALPMEQVVGVLRAPPIRCIPAAPQALLGLANLRGSVVPIVALDRLLGLSTAADNGDSRIVLLALEQPLGVRVDEVENVVTPGETDGISLAADASANGVMGHHRDEEGRIVQWLDVGRLVREQLVSARQEAPALPGTGGGGALEARGRKTGEPAEWPVPLVSFEVAGQRFAFRLEHVQQILRLPEEISAVPNAPAYLLGLMTLRGAAMPLVALGRWFSLDAPHRPGAPVVVLHLEGMRIGLIVDEVHQVMRLMPGTLRRFPAMAGPRASGDIEAVWRGDENHPLISILSERPFMALARQFVGGSADASSDAASSEGQRPSNEPRRSHEEEVERLRFLEFTLSDQRYCLPIDRVEGIAQPPQTPYTVPSAPAFIDGMMNLRGAVVPIVDTARRLGLTDEGAGSGAVRAGRRLVVVLNGGVRSALLVDVVNNVIHVDADWVESAPVRLLGDEVLVEQLIRLPDSREVIQLMNLTALFSAEDQAALLESAETEQAEAEDA